MARPSVVWCGWGHPRRTCADPGILVITTDYNHEQPPQLRRFDSDSGLSWSASARVGSDLFDPTVDIDETDMTPVDPVDTNTRQARMVIFNEESAATYRACFGLRQVMCAQAEHSTSQSRYAWTLRRDGVSVTTGRVVLIVSCGLMAAVGIWFAIAWWGEANEVAIAGSLLGVVVAVEVVVLATVTRPRPRNSLTESNDDSPLLITDDDAYEGKLRNGVRQMSMLMYGLGNFYGPLGRQVTVPIINDDLRAAYRQIYIVSTIVNRPDSRESQ